MKKITFLSILLCFTLLQASAFQNNIELDCNEPINTNFCYISGETTSYTFTNLEGFNLNVVVNEGEVESGWDNFIVLDSDGSELYNGFGNSGDLSGLSFQSSDNQITIQVIADFSVDCETGNFIPIDLTVTCATCINPEIDFNVISDCAEGEQFLIDVDISSMGDASTLTIFDNQGNDLEVSSSGNYSLGPYPNGLGILVSIENTDDANCIIQSSMLTQDLCSLNYIDCSESPLNVIFCYSNNEENTYVYESIDGTNLNLQINSGFIEAWGDSFTVYDTDNSILYSGNGDISGEVIQSIGGTISVEIISDSTGSCETNNYDPIEYDVYCATCTNFDANYEVVSNCGANSSDFSIQVDINDLGSATGLVIEDNQNTPPLIVNDIGSYVYGDFSNGTDVVISILNIDDSNCFAYSPVLTQEYCPEDYLEVTDAYTVEQLVNDFLMSSVCSQTFNITYSTGTTFGTPANGLAYFTNNGNIFTLEEGIVLTTGHFADVPGPETGSQGTGLGGWPGDQDLEDAVPELEQGFSNDATILEFDFVPFGEEMSFNFLFASDEYGFYQCEYSDAFAFLLTDSNGNTQNLAVVPASNDPVSVVTIRDENYNTNCTSENVNYFDTYYGSNSTGEDGVNPFESPINFRGSTVVLNASAMVNSGEQYHIKLVIADRADSILDSAVFIEAGSFDVGEINLGENIAVGCGDQETIIDSGLPNDFIGNIEWYYSPHDPEAGSDGELLSDSDGNVISTPTINVTNDGYYTVAVSVGNSNCAMSDTVFVNFGSEIVLDLPDEDQFCVSENYQIDATPSNASDFETIDYVWYFDGEQLPNENTSVITVSNPGVYMVEIDVNSNDCPPYTHSIELEAIEFDVYFNDSGYDVCYEQGENIIYEIVPNIDGISPEDLSSIIYEWQDGSSASTYIVEDSGQFEVMVNYQGCQKTASVTISFVPEPELQAISDQEICPGDFATFAGSIFNSQEFDSLTYQWLNDQDQTIGTDNQISLAETGIYKLLVSGTTSEGAFCESLEQFSLTNTDIQLSLPEDQNFCGLDDFLIVPQISGSDVINPQYIWQDASGSFLANTEELLVNSSGVYTLSMVMDNCTVLESIAVNFNAVAQLDLGTDIVTCDDVSDLPILNATPTNLEMSQVSFEWFYNGQILANETSSELDASQYGYGNYLVEVFVIGNNQNCTSTIEELSIFKENNIEVTLSSNDINNTYCVGETVEITAAITGEVNSDSILYAWYADGELLENEHASSISFPMKNQTNSPVNYKVIVGQGACSQNATITIFKYNNEECVITQGISPNTSTGLNDNLDLRFLSDRSGIKNFKVFNRYGTIVYEKDNYKNEFEGKDINGRLLPTGTYYYVIFLKDEDPVFGSIIKDWIYVNQSTK